MICGVNVPVSLSKMSDAGDDQSFNASDSS